jgi:hypothetical protein
MEPASPLTSGLSAIMSSVDRVKRSIDVQKKLASVQSGCLGFGGLVEKKPEQSYLLETWRIVRSTGLDEIEEMITDAEGSNAAGDLVALKELKQVLKCAGDVGDNLAKENQGVMKESLVGLMKSLQSAATACRNWNEQELTKIGPSRTSF